MTPRRLFLDDVREVQDVYPQDDPATWVVCRSMEAACAAVLAAWPCHVSLDHDLGDGVPTGQDFARWLVELDLDTGGMPRGFTFAVHSANPPGAANMRSLLEGYLRHRGA